MCYWEDPISATRMWGGRKCRRAVDAWNPLSPYYLIIQLRWSEGGQWLLAHQRDRGEPPRHRITFSFRLFHCTSLYSSKLFPHWDRTLRLRANNGSLECRRRTRKVRLSANLFTFAKSLFHGSLVRSLITSRLSRHPVDGFANYLVVPAGLLHQVIQPMIIRLLPTSITLSDWYLTFLTLLWLRHARRSRAASRLPEKGPWNEFASSALLAIDLNFSCESRLVHSRICPHAPLLPLFFSLRRRNNRFCDDLAGIRGQCATRIA